MNIEERKQEIQNLTNEMKAFIEARDVDSAKAKKEEIRKAKELLELEVEQEEEERKQLENQSKKEERKKDVKVENREKQTAMELRAIIKATSGRGLTSEERALLTTNANGEGYILPSDVTTKIHKLIRERKSFRDVCGYMKVTTLTGSFPIENFETVTELIDFTDGTNGTEANDIKFKNVSFSLKEKGALMQLSNTLLAMTDNDLINYVAEVFARKAVVTENKMAVVVLKNGKTVKAIADYKALKKSINVDLDEGIKYGTVIVTNQDGFDKLDGELDGNGRPILQPDPTNPTAKRFMGYPVVVYSNSTLETTGTTAKKAPIFFGNLEEAVKFVDNGKIDFATSQHAGFTANTTMARVIEYVDVIQVDASDKVYIVGELTL